MTDKTTNPKNLSPQFLRKRKMLLVLPLLVLPFITLGFWTLGGGSGDMEQKAVSSAGLNLQLPDAHLKDERSSTKLSFYEEADKDSSRLGRQIKDDPFLQSRQKDTSHHFESLGSESAGYPAMDYKDSNEEKVYQKLALLNQQLNTTPLKNSPTYTTDKTPPANKGDAEGPDPLTGMNKDSGTNDRKWII